MKPFYLRAISLVYVLLLPAVTPGCGGRMAGLWARSRRRPVLAVVANHARKRPPPETGMGIPHCHSDRDRDGQEVTHHPVVLPPLDLIVARLTGQSQRLISDGGLGCHSELRSSSQSMPVANRLLSDPARRLMAANPAGGEGRRLRRLGAAHQAPGSARPGLAKV